MPSQTRPDEPIEVPAPGPLDAEQADRQPPVTTDPASAPFHAVADICTGSEVLTGDDGIYGATAAVARRTGAGRSAAVAVTRAQERPSTSTAAVNSSELAARGCPRRCRGRPDSHHPGATVPR